MKAYVTGRKRVQITELDIALSITYTLKTKPKPNQLLASFILSQRCVPRQCLVQAPGLKRGCLSGIGAFQNGLVILETKDKPLACEA